MKTQKIKGISMVLDLELNDGKEFPRGYTNNFRGTGEDAFALHGNEEGKLLVGTKVSKKPWGGRYQNTRDTRWLTPASLASAMKRDLNVDLYAGSGSTGPVHLLSCYAKQ